MGSEAISCDPPGNYCGPTWEIWGDRTYFSKKDGLTRQCASEATVLWYVWTHLPGPPSVADEPAAAAGPGFSTWQGGDSGVAGTGATVACAG